MPTTDIIYKSIYDLIFDPKNPRLPQKLQGYDKDVEVLEWMIKYENVTELIGSIGERGYFPAEALLVIESESKPGKYEVVEGNRRLAAVKLLNNPSLATFKKQSIAEATGEAKEKPLTLPTIVFPSRSEITIYLGYRHITGVKEWGALAKAKYLEELRITLDISDETEAYRTLAKIIGSNISYVRSILLGLKVYNLIEENDFFGIDNLDETSIEFGVLYTATNRKGISCFIGIDPSKEKPFENVKLEELKELTSWMFERNPENLTRLGESRNISDLDKVVANEAALRLFRAGEPLSSAVLYTDKPNEIFNKLLNSSLQKLKTALSQLHNIASPDPSQVETLDEIFRLTRDMRNTLRSKIEENE